MQSPKPGIALAIVITVAVLAGVAAAYRRFHVEAANRRIEIALEWQEVSQLAQSSGRRLPEILDLFKQEHVTSLVLAEDTITSLEQTGAIHPERTMLTGNAATTVARVNSRADLARIGDALRLRGQLDAAGAGNPAAAVTVRTIFRWLPGPDNGNPGASSQAGRPMSIASTSDYSSLRTLGLGLPPEAILAANAAGLHIAGRISNFPGVTLQSALDVLKSLRRQGATTVIFSGEEVLGFRDLEKSVAEAMRPANAGTGASAPAEPSARVADDIPTYGAVEFGKQKGDEKFAGVLHGDYVRVHSIQSAELGQMEKEEAVDRFVRAAKERNIRFCYVRLETFAGQDAVEANAKFLNEIARGMAQGNSATGGGLRFGPARRFADTGVSSGLFALIALGAAAGTVWMLRAIVSLDVPTGPQIGLLIGLGLACVVVVLVLGETGRKLVAFLAGVVYPATACLITFPSRRIGTKSPFELEGSEAQIHPLVPLASLRQALIKIGAASAITALGIVQVVGLLATRPFMMRANQFLGIKAQHAVPLLIVALVALAGGVAGGESWAQFRARAGRRLREAVAEPARFGTLLLGLLALAGLALVVARTGNDAGVGVSGTELKLRAILDRVLPVRPRTKEFLVGHPAFVLALAWWYRGRRRIAVPAFVVGSLGQVSLLNTFCHIHTPLIISIWRDGLGLFFGILLGSALFLALEIAFNVWSGKTSERSI